MKTTPKNRPPDAPRLRQQPVERLAPPTDEVLHLRSEVQRLQSALEHRKTDAGRISDAMAAVLAAVKRASPIPGVWRPDAAGPKKSKAIMVVQATDWHIGATTKPEFIEEFGAFNYDIARERVRAWLNKLLNHLTAIRAGYAVDECVVIGTADWVSGDIHEELVRTNEFPCPVQAVRAGELLGEFIRQLAPNFRTVRAEILCAGNHDRITRKPQSEQGGINSWGYVTAEIARAHVERIPNVAYKTFLGSSGIVTVGGMRYLIMHGDGIPAHMGVPHFGMDRLVMREALRRMNREEEFHFDAMVVGHWHVANNLLYCRYGGCLSGTTAHDHKFARHAKPHQTSWFVHPTHGEFHWNRWWL